MLRRHFLVTALAALIAPRVSPARPGPAAQSHRMAWPDQPGATLSLGESGRSDPPAHGSEGVQPGQPRLLGPGQTDFADRQAQGAQPARSDVADQPTPSITAKQAAPGPQPILLQQSPLAGFQYHQGPQLWSLLQTGQALRLTREPANPYDPRAVRIDWNGAKLGYLPRLDNAAAAQLLDRGEHLTARIAALAEDRDPWRRVAVEVYLTPADPADGHRRT